MATLQEEMEHAQDKSCQHRVYCVIAVGIVVLGVNAAIILTGNANNFYGMLGF